MLCLFIPPPGPTSGNHWSFYHPHTFALSRCHIGIIQYAVFLDWLLSLNNMHLRFIHVFSWLDSLFLFGLNNISLSSIPQFIYPFTTWRTSWLLPSFGNHEESCYKYPCTGFCVDMFSLPLGEYQGTQLMNHMVRV